MMISKANLYPFFAGAGLMLVILILMTYYVSLNILVNTLIAGMH